MILKGRLAADDDEDERDQIMHKLKVSFKNIKLGKQFLINDIFCLRQFTKIWLMRLYKELSKVDQILVDNVLKSGR